MKWRNLECRLDISTFELMLLKFKTSNSPPPSPSAENDLSESISPAKANSAPSFASRNANNCIVTTKPIDPAHPYCLEFSFYPAAQGLVKKSSLSLTGGDGQAGTVSTWTLAFESKAKMDELINAVRQLQASKSKCMDKYAEFKAVTQAAILNNWQKSRGDARSRAEQSGTPNAARRASVSQSANAYDAPNRAWQASFARPFMFVDSSTSQVVLILPTPAGECHSPGKRPVGARQRGMVGGARA